jgi:hypothetical protein
MYTLASLLLLTAMTVPTPILVLRDGTRIDVDGSVRQEDGRVVFRHAGVLYSLPGSQVDFDATRAAAANVTVVRGDEDRMKFKVSRAERERLLRELEQNHNGTPSTTTEGLRVFPASPEAATNSQEEWSWRRESRGYEEAVRRAKEELQMLYDRADSLKQRIVTLSSLGYKPGQFTYETSQLEVTYEEIPRAQLEVDRAQRALDQFRDDARRLGVLPGWLR